MLATANPRFSFHPDSQPQTIPRDVAPKFAHRLPGDIHTLLKHNLTALKVIASLCNLSIHEPFTLLGNSSNMLRSDLLPSLRLIPRT